MTHITTVQLGDFLFRVALDAECRGSAQVITHDGDLRTWGQERTTITLRRTQRGFWYFIGSAVEHTRHVNRPELQSALEAGYQSLLGGVGEIAR